MKAALTQAALTQAASQSEPLLQMLCLLRVALNHATHAAMATSLTSIWLATVPSLDISSQGTSFI